jgi:hypothetical protein
MCWFIGSTPATALPEESYSFHISLSFPSQQPTAAATTTPGAAASTAPPAAAAPAAVPAGGNAGLNADEQAQLAELQAQLEFA